MNEFQMIEEIKVETKMFKFIDIVSVFVIMGFLMFGFLLSNMVLSALKIPFIIYNGLVGMLFMFKSPWNKDLKIWKSLALFVRNRIHARYPYHAVSCEIQEKDIISCNPLMYNSRYLSQQPEVNKYA